MALLARTAADIAAVAEEIAAGGGVAQPSAVDITAWGFRQATSFGTNNLNIPYCTISNVAVTTTFSEAVTATWPTPRS